MAVRNAASCGLPMPGLAKRAAGEARSEKLKHDKQKDADDACSQRHHLDRAVDRIAHRGVGFWWGIRHERVTKIRR
jgi:hypothetical protein